MTADELARLPASVHVKTPTRSFNLFFYFALDGAGRIWVKSIPGASPETDPVAPDWRLFLGTGLPHDDARAQFARPACIESINADLDEVMAVSDDHRLYSLRWFPNPVFKEDTPPRTWADVHGWPVHGPLMWDRHVVDNRGWAIGRRTRSFVLFEDVAGRTFDGGGGLSTYYVLTADGTSIAFSDSGLPPDFSHTIGGPDRSTFVAETMEVSADTIFVINAYGELRTRMVDFDTDGSDTMFFVYSYDRHETRPDAIAIPAEDWLAHARIPLEGQAQIAARLAIVLTGKHNRDRELRVAGFDRDRRPGYYWKPIFDQVLGSPARRARDDWRFATDETVAVEPDRLLDPADTDPDATRGTTRTPVPVPRWQHAVRPPARVAARNMAFTGELRVDGALLDVTVEVLDFHLEWSPARLRFTAGGEAIEVTLHTAEKWYHLLRVDPGHDGTPKEFQATLELTAEALTTDQPVLRMLVTDVLARFHLVAFAWFVQATEDYLQITSKPRPRSGRALPAVALALVRAGRGYASLGGARQVALRHETFAAAAHAPTLAIGRPLAELTSADAPALRLRVAQNLHVASTLVTAAAAPQRQDAATPAWLRPGVLGALRYAARPWLIGVVLPLLPFRNISTTEAAYYAKNLATNLPLLLARSRELKEALLGYARHDLAHALMVIDTRTAAYARRLAQLGGTAPDAPFSYFEDLAGFWHAFRFGPCALTGLLPVSGTSACSAVVRDDEMTEPPVRAPGSPEPRARPAGLVIDIACGPATLALRIIPTSLERDVFRASLRSPEPVGSARNPLRTPVRVQVDHAAPSPATRAVIAWVFRTPALAASEDAPAELVIDEGSYRVTGAGFAFAWHAGGP